MTLSQPRPMVTVSVKIPAELKARLDAVAEAAKEQGYEFSYDRRLSASLATIISQNERVLRIGRFDMPEGRRFPQKPQNVEAARSESVPDDGRGD